MWGCSQEAHIISLTKKSVSAPSVQTKAVWCNHCQIPAGWVLGVSDLSRHTFPFSEFNFGVTAAHHEPLCLSDWILNESQVPIRPKEFCTARKEDDLHVFMVLEAEGVSCLHCDAE